MRRKAAEEEMAMIREANWKAMQGEVAGRGERWSTKAGWLGIVAAAFLIFAVLPAQAQTEKILHSFTGPPADGGSPSGSLVRDAGGNLFGTTQNGGALGEGAVFELAINPDGNYTESVLYSFGGAMVGDGQVPSAGLVIDGSGKLYGTTQSGGISTNCSFGCGTVFMLDNSSGSYKYSQLYSFTGSPDGESPGALLIDNANGNIYGTSEFGGTSKSANCKSGCGTVFELAINPDGSYTYSLLYSFAATGDGRNPQGKLIRDSSTGYLYGTTGAGGALGNGTVFELDNSTGTYKDTLLYSFTGGSDGEIPSGLVMDAHGNLFGTAENGGSTACPMGCGTVFELVYSSGSYAPTPSVLHSFTGSPEAQNPASLIMDASGNLYGTAGGGASTACIGCGTVFELAINPDGSYTYAGVLYSFTGSPDGAQPTGLFVGASGKLYGTTGLGGASTVCSSSGCGTVFELVSGTAGTTDTISATSGSEQRATVGASFAAPLVATVLDSNNNAVSNITVTFTAPSSGASGTFANGNTAMVTTDTSGHAAATFTANNTAGSYLVTATALNVTGTATFSLQNLPAQVQTTTTITGTTSSLGSFALPASTALVGTTSVVTNFTVTAASGTPSGTVTVTDGFNAPTDTCSLALNNKGAGSCSLTISQAGSVTLKATYSPDQPAINSGFASSSSTYAENVVEIVACGTAPGTPTVTQGGTIPIPFTVCPASNVNGQPTATITGGCPLHATCSVAVTSAANGAYTVTLTLVTTASSIPLQDPQPRDGPWPLTLLAFGALLAILMALQMARQNRVRPRLLYGAGLLLAMVLSGMSGCSGSSSNQNATPLGNAVINVDVKAGNFSVTVPINVMVTK